MPAEYVKHGLWWVFVFIIKFLVPITLILINSVYSMNSFRLVHYETYQRRSLLVRHLVGRSAHPLGRTSMQI
jgi:hypothetical protein